MPRKALPSSSGGAPAKVPICQNRRARYNYAIVDTLEAGVVLTGTEVKACRAGHAQLSDGFVQVLAGEAMLTGVHIDVYTQGNRFNHEPLRTRKLLLHRREIDKLAGRLHSKGTSAVPLSMYFKDGRVKIEIGLGTGKAATDKRQTIRQREAGREVQRALRGGAKRHA